MHALTDACNKKMHARMHLEGEVIDLAANRVLAVSKNHIQIRVEPAIRGRIDAKLVGPPKVSLQSLVHNLLMQWLGGEMAMIAEPPPLQDKLSGDENAMVEFMRSKNRDENEADQLSVTLRMAKRHNKKIHNP